MNDSTSLASRGFGRIAAHVLPIVALTCIILIAVMNIDRRPGTTPPAADTAAPVPITFCVAGQPPSALVHLALDRGLFAAEGLRVEAREYVSGKRALKAMLAGEGQLATTADVPIVFESFKAGTFRMLCQIAATGNPACVVANRTAGIAEPEDLRGKTVATQRGSAVHFYLHMFLARHGIPEEQVTLSFMKAEELPEALIDGRIDAFSMREPYVSQATDALGDNAVVFAEPGLYHRTEHVVVASGLIETHPGVPDLIVRALLQAEKLAKADPQALVTTLAGRLGISHDAATAALAQHEWRVCMEQALLIGLEDEAAWAQNAGLVDTESVPNYLDFLHPDALSRADPGRVTILR